MSIYQDHVNGGCQTFAGCLIHSKTRIEIKTLHKRSTRGIRVQKSEDYHLALWSTRHAEWTAHVYMTC